MKKIFKMLLVFLILVGFISLSCYANAEEIENETEPTVEEEIEVDVEEEIVYECVILEPIVENGIITFSAKEGKVGEVVEIYYTADLLYDLVEMTANGVVLTPNEYGIYSFILVEGNNVITAKFEVSDEKLEKVAELLEQAKDKNWEEIFTVSNLLQLGSWLITIFCSSGFFVTLYKSKKFKELTPYEIARKVDEKIDSVLDERLNTFLTNVFGPFTDKFTNTFEKLENSTKTLVRCFILMQENTPESRLAILNELNTLNNNETGKLTLQIKELIAEEIKKKEEQEKKLEQSIEELKEENQMEIPHL